MFNQLMKSGVTCGSAAAFVAMAECVSVKSIVVIIFITIVSIACLGIMKFSKKSRK
ncbi:MAG: hypothetical protein ACR5KV_05770 [Wolbachia sp.]